MAETFLRIGVDSRQAVAGFRQYERASDGAKRSTRELDALFKRSEGSFKRLASSAASLRTGFAALAAGGIALATRRAIELGAAVGETASKFETVLGPNIGTATQFLSEWGFTAGLSTTQGQELFATTTAIAEGFGFAGDAAVRYAEDVVRLSGDLASFNNLPTEDVIRRITAAASGERESLKQLGIVITEAEVQARALADTNKRAASELTQADKAAATYALAVSKAGKAVGDLDRTQNSLGNALKQLGSIFTDVGEQGSAAFAEEITPAIIDLRDFVRENREEIVGFFEDIGTAAGTAAEAATTLARGIKTLADTITGQFIPAIEEQNRRAKELEERIQNTKREAANVRATSDVAGGRQDELVTLTGILQTLGFIEDTDERRRRILQEVAADRERFGEILEDNQDALEKLADLEDKRLQLIREQIEEALRLNEVQSGRINAGGLATTGQAGFGRRQPLPPGGFLGFGGGPGGLFLTDLVKQLDEASLSTGALTDEVVDWTDGLLRAIPGVVSLADGLGNLDPALRSAIRGIGDLAVGLRNLGQGSFLGNLPGILGIVGGGINLLSGLFGGGGPSQADLQRQAEDQRRANELLAKIENNTRETADKIEATAAFLDRFGVGLERRRESLAGPPTTVAGFQEAQAQESAKFFDQLLDLGLAPAIIEALRQAGPDVLAEALASGTFIGPTGFGLELAGGNLEEAIRTLVDLFEIQTLELEQFTKALQEQAEAERNLADARADALRRVNQQFEENLQLRNLEVRGLDEEAEVLRFQIDQQRELQQAIDQGVNEDLIVKLTELQKLEFAKFLEPPIPEPSIRRQTETRSPRVTPEVVSVTSAQETTVVGLLNTNRSMLIQLREINENTRGLRSLGFGGLSADEALGLSTLTNQRLSGNAVL